MDFLQTTLCYLEKDGCYLMLHRVKKNNDANPDQWVGVGGHFGPRPCVTCKKTAAIGGCPLKKINTTPTTISGSASAESLNRARMPLPA